MTHGRSLLTHAWNLPEAARTAVRFHRRPEEAPCHHLAAEIVFLAAGLAHDPVAKDLAERCSHLDSAKIDFASIARELEEVKASIATLI